MLLTAGTSSDAFDAQLSVPYNSARPVKVMMLDVFEASPARLQELKSRGVHTICAINAGAWENWRPDSGAFDLRLVGSNDAGWQGERYLDIRAQDALRPISPGASTSARAKASMPSRSTIPTPMPTAADSR